MQPAHVYPPSAGSDTIKSGERVFIATPASINEQIPMQPTDSANQPLVVNSQPTKPSVYLLNGKHVFRLGITSVVVGFLIFVCGISCVTVFGEKNYNKASSGIWGGVFIMVAGSLSIVSGLRLTNRVLNAVNLAFHSYVLACCIGCLTLFGLNIQYYGSCVRRYFHEVYKYLAMINKLCPSERDEAVAVYSLMIVLVVVQMHISITVIIFCCRTYPPCRSGNCCSCSCGCCLESSANTSSNPQQTQFQTGHATMSPNVESITPGQILYMMTPVAVTTQRPQELPANQIPQATMVMH